MNDGAALLAAILRHPEEDTPRLMYADWLDENGDHHRARFIRAQIRGESALPPLTMLVEMEPVLGRQSHQVARVAGKTHATVQTPAVVLTYLRGFLSEIACPAADWLTHGAAICARQPVTDVRLLDKAPRPHGNGPAVEGWRWGRAGFGDDYDESSWLLPVDVFDLLAVARVGVDELAEECRGYPYAYTFDNEAKVSRPADLLYLTPDRANTAASRACVALGRQRAGLTEEPIVARPVS